MLNFPVEKKFTLQNKYRNPECGSIWDFLMTFWYWIEFYLQK